MWSWFFLSASSSWPKLLGKPVSPGVAEGVVHVIRDPQREALAPDEILVAEFAAPGWIRLFISASLIFLDHLKRRSITL